MRKSKLALDLLVFEMRYGANGFTVVFIVRPAILRSRIRISIGVFRRAQGVLNII